MTTEETNGGIEWYQLVAGASDKSPQVVPSSNDAYEKHVKQINPARDAEGNPLSDAVVNTTPVYFASAEVIHGSTVSGSTLSAERLAQLFPPKDGIAFICTKPEIAHEFQSLCFGAGSNVQITAASPSAVGKISQKNEPSIEMADAKQIDAPLSNSDMISGKGQQIS